MTQKKIKIATRKSKLALWQANFVGQQLSGLGFEYQLIEMTTEGDRVQDRYLHEIGGKGLFIKEVEKALLTGEADIAVHSLKDVPIKIAESCTLAAISKRHKREDILLFNQKLFPELKNAQYHEIQKWDWSDRKVGTSSLRRHYQLKKHFGEVKVEKLRGNVNTRLQKLRDGEYDAILLAGASNERLKLSQSEFLSLPLSEFVPCAGQGALAIEAKKEHPFLSEFQKLEDKQTRLEVNLERELLAQLGGDCTMPCGLHVIQKGDHYLFMAMVLDESGSASHFEMKCSEDEISNDCAEVAKKMLTHLKANRLDEIFSNLGLTLPEAKQ